MKNVLFVLVALLLVVSIGQSQIIGDQTYTYRGNKIVKNTYDTIPNLANTAGSTGWLYVGNNNVAVTLSLLDSANLEYSVDYADSASGPVAANAYVYPHASRAHAVGEDSVFSKTATSTGNAAMTSKIFRDHSGGTDLIPGGTWVRFIIHATNTDEQALAAAKSYIYRFRVRVWQGN